jgi:hypothetical protein
MEYLYKDNIEIRTLMMFQLSNKRKKLKNISAFYISEKNKERKG